MRALPHSLRGGVRSGLLRVHGSVAVKRIMIRHSKDKYTWRR